MSRLDRHLAGFTENEKATIKDQLKKLKQRRWSEINVKKIRGSTYRLKHGRLRILYEKLPLGHYKILKIARRDDQTYRDY